PLILGRSFLKTERALIDVFEGELTLRVEKEAITFNLDQTSRIGLCLICQKSAKNRIISTQEWKSEENPDQKAVLSE
nr:reverse transcriptase domain-containing protein [Tanacetum cinerariifolium]